jgi:hypothetical protein
MMVDGEMGAGECIIVTGTGKQQKEGNTGV